MKLLQVAAFITLTAVFLYRFRVVFARGGSWGRLVRPEFLYPWLACGVGALAMLTQGILWPQQSLDAPLGGDNVLKLVQDVLTITAFSFGAWTAIDLSSSTEELRRTRRTRWLLLLSFLAALIVSFFLTPDRGPTSYLYVEHNQWRWTVWIFAMVYIVELGTMTVVLLRGIWARKPWPYWFFRVGGLAILVACISEAADLCITHIAPLHAYEGAGRALFDPFFYPGVVIVVAALGIFAGTKWQRRRRITKQIHALAEICRRRGIRADADGEGFGALAQLAVRVRDAHIAQAVLDAHDLQILNAVEAFMESELGHLVDFGDALELHFAPARLA